MKAIKHSHYEQYLRLSNDDAALLVSSGRWVFVSKFEARKAIERQRPHRPVLARIGMFAAAALAVIALLVLSTSARAAGLPCMTKAEAMATGKHAKYRQIEQRKCWYVTKRTPAKSEFKIYAGKSPVPSTLAARFSPGDSASRRGEPAPVNAHPIGIAVSLPRLIQQEAPRVEERSSSILEVSAVRRTDFTVTLEDDAVLAMSGKPELRWEFDAYWAEMTGWTR